MIHHSTVFSKLGATISQARKMKFDGQRFAQGFITDNALRSDYSHMLSPEILHHVFWGYLASTLYNINDKLFVN